MSHGIYLIKAMFRKKSTLFWSLAFPILLGTIFYFMFGGIQKMEMFSEIQLGVVVSENTEFVEVAESITMENGKNMFVVTTFDNKDDALKALENEEIKGIVDLHNNYELTVLKSATDTTMIKSFLDQYRQDEQMLRDIARNHPEKLEAAIASMSGETARHIKVSNIDLKGQDKDCYSQYFFALLAMTCLLSSSVGSTVGCNIQPNCSVLGARRGVAPTSKARQILTDFLATFILCDLMALVVLVFCIFVLKRDFGTNLPLIILTTFAGNFNGIAAGMFIATYAKGGEKQKEGLCVAYFMTSSFFAGLQWADITFILEKKAPIINRINPATLIVNSFKSLAVFGDYQKYATNMITLMVIGVLFLVLSVLKLRRTRYASL